MVTITTTTALDTARAHRIMRHEVRYNPALNGAEYTIKRGDAPEIDGIDAYTGAALFACIFRPIEEPALHIDEMLASYTDEA